MRLFLGLLAALLAGCMDRAPSTGPAARVRVLFDQGGIVHTLAEGHSDISAARPADPEDPVRVASISKLAVAIGVMRLVEGGHLELDKDVSHYLGWDLRHPGWPDHPITVEMLLSHQSGLTDAAGYGGPFDRPIRDKMKEAGVWDSAHAPGTYFRYANINYPVIATIMEKATNERFDLLMKRLVFDPLSLDACFNWASCSDEAVKRAVVLYDRSGNPLADNLGGERASCEVAPSDDGSCRLATYRPGLNGGAFAPQGGLRISANGLAVIGRLLIGNGEINGIRLLHPSSVDRILNPVWTYNGSNGETFDAETADPGGALFCRYGLGAQTLVTPSQLCSDDPFADGRPRQGHPGEAYGLVSGLWIDRATGTGVAYYITGADLTAYGPSSAFYADEERLLSEPAGISSSRMR
jgi:CubicO group peptidase (beta-lactamase class C family)